MGKVNAFINLSLLMGPLILGFIFSLSLFTLVNRPTLYLAIIVLFFLVSITSLIFSKLAKLHKRDLLTLGPGPIQQDQKKYYYGAYAFLGMGVLLSLFLIAFANNFS